MKLPWEGEIWVQQILYYSTVILNTPQCDDNFLFAFITLTDIEVGSLVASMQTEDLTGISHFMSFRPKLFDNAYCIGCNSEQCELISMCMHFVM